MVCSRRICVTSKQGIENGIFFETLYGEPRWEDKYKTWDKLWELHNGLNLPWVVIGDFNEILFSNEKEGGNPRPLNFMQAFRDALADCNFDDLGYSGNIYTTKRGHIRERLDRVVANNAWNIMHPNATVQHLDYTRSDHRPILLDTDFQVMNNRRSGPRRFESKWLKENELREVVQHAWEAAASATSGGVLSKLEHMHGALHRWIIMC
jgi:hypothetical protein